LLTRCGGADWIELAQDREWRWAPERWAPENAVMNLGGSIKCGEFYWELVSFSRRSLLRGVRKLLIVKGKTKQYR